MPSEIAPGRPVWLELNAQRVTTGISFYQALFGWTSRPLHVPPWGAIPNVVNGSRIFGNQFMAMGSFAPPKWNIWFSADLERAEAAVTAAGGDIGQGIHTLGDLGQMLNVSDPWGNAFSMIRLADDPPEYDACGDPCRAEFWGKRAAELPDFYAQVLGLKLTITPTGAMLSDGPTARLFFRDGDYEMPPRWIPYFRTSSTGGDCERARRAGAVVQIHEETIPHLGGLVVLSDPAGAYFGLVDISDAKPVD